MTALLIMGKGRLYIIVNYKKTDINQRFEGEIFPYNFGLTEVRSVIEKKKKKAQTLIKQLLFISSN